MTDETYTGVNGTIRANANSLTLTKSGLGVDKTPRSIPLGALSGVRMTAPTSLGTRGYLTLGLGGEDAAELGMMKAANDTNSVLFKRGEQHAAFQRLHDWLLLVIDQNRSSGVDATSVAFDAPAKSKLEVQSDTVAADKEARQLARQEKAAVRTTDKEAREVAKQEQLAADLARYGAQVQKFMFGVKSVALYEKGYVRVGTFKLGEYEQLRSVKYGRTVRDKSAGGRAAAAMMTGGLSMLTSNEKLNLFLTIATDKRVHSLHVEGGRSDEKAGMAIEVAGNALIEGLRAAPVPPTQIQVAQLDIADQIRKLADLHSAGILTDAEFSAKKADLLGRM